MLKINVGILWLAKITKTNASNKYISQFILLLKYL